MTTRKELVRFGISSGLSGLSGLSGVGIGSFSPVDIAGLELWLKADEGTFQDSAKTTPATSDGDVVGAWEDQSGNGNDALQAVTARKPTLRLSVLNGLPIIRFDGGDGLVSPSVSLAGFTIFTVFRASGAAGLIYEHSVNAQLNPGTWLFSTQAETLRTRRNADISDKRLTVNWGVDNVWRIATHRFDGTHAGHQLWLDSSLQSLTDGVNTDNPGTSTATDIFSVASRNGSSVFTTGDIAEITAYNTALSTTNRSLVETYLNGRYAIF